MRDSAGVASLKVLLLGRLDLHSVVRLEPKNIFAVGIAILAKRLGSFASRVTVGRKRHGDGCL